MLEFRGFDASRNPPRAGPPTSKSALGSPAASPAPMRMHLRTALESLTLHHAGPGLAMKRCVKCPSMASASLMPRLSMTTKLKQSTEL
jgi:hypothetical protein